MALDQIGGPLCGLQFSPVLMGHGHFGQEANEACLLLRGHSWWPACETRVWPSARLFRHSGTQRDIEGHCLRDTSCGGQSHEGTTAG